MTASLEKWFYAMDGLENDMINYESLFHLDIRIEGLRPVQIPPFKDHDSFYFIKIEAHYLLNWTVMLHEHVAVVCRKMYNKAKKLQYRNGLDPKIYSSYIKFIKNWGPLGLGVWECLVNEHANSLWPQTTLNIASLTENIENTRTAAWMIAEYLQMRQSAQRAPKYYVRRHKSTSGDNKVYYGAAAVAPTQASPDSRKRSNYNYFDSASDYKFFSSARADHKNEDSNVLEPASDRKRVSFNIPDYSDSDRVIAKKVSPKFSPGFSGSASAGAVAAHRKNGGSRHYHQYSNRNKHNGYFHSDFSVRDLMNAGYNDNDYHNDIFASASEKIDYQGHDDIFVSATREIDYFGYSASDMNRSVYERQNRRRTYYNNFNPAPGSTSSSEARTFQLFG